MGQMMGGAMWGLPSLGLLVGLGLVLVLGTVAVAVLFGRRGSDPDKEILRQRFARGEDQRRRVRRCDEGARVAAVAAPLGRVAISSCRTP